MKKGLKDWNFESPSRIRSQAGYTIGDDLCAPIPRDIRAPGLEVSRFLPRPFCQLHNIRSF